METERIFGTIEGMTFARASNGSLFARIFIENQVIIVFNDAIFHKIKKDFIPGQSVGLEIDMKETNSGIVKHATRIIPSSEAILVEPQVIEWGTPKQKVVQCAKELCVDLEITKEDGWFTVKATAPEGSKFRDNNKQDRMASVKRGANTAIAWNTIWTALKKGLWKKETTTI